MNVRFAPLVLLSFLLTISSCKKEEESGWSTEVLVPLVNSSLSIQNIVKDSSIRTNSDNSLTLAYKSNLFSFNLADQIIDIPDTSIGQKFTLDSLGIAQQSVSYTITLDSLSQIMAASSDPGAAFLGQYIRLQAGNTTAVPPLNGFATSAYQFDASGYFTQVTLAQGILEFWLVNNLPIPITDVELESRNTVGGQVLTHDYISYIGPYDSVYRAINLAGLTMEGNITFDLLNMNSPGTNGQPVLINLNDYVQIRARTFGMKASDAYARFPSQDVISITGEVTQEIGDRKLTYIDARSGFLHVYISSSVQEQLTLTYILDGAYDKYGRPLRADNVVPPAQPGQQSRVDQLYDISGYSISLTGQDGTKFNTYTQTIIAHIDSSGVLRHITAADSVNIRYELVNIKPNYVKGYAGKDSLITIDSTAYSFLDIIQGGTLDLEDVNMKLTVDNGIGVDGYVKINGLTAISDRNGARQLSGSIVGQQLNVNRASDFPLTPAHNEFVVNNSNSNIAQLLSLLPNKLKYDVEVRTNPSGNNQTYRDFAYLESSLNVALDAEVPLSLIANDLLLVDTIDFDLSNTTTNVAGIKDGVLNFIIQNRYPLDADVTMLITDENWNVIDSVLVNQHVAAADLNAQCLSAGPKRTKVQLFVDEARMERLKSGRHAYVRADFSTQQANSGCNGQYIKIYSDYKLDVTLTAKFNYRIQPKF